MAETLNVKERDKGGKRESRRLRRTGGIPAVLYGHGEANKNLAVVADEMAAVVRHGGRVVDLAGAVMEKAFIRACNGTPTARTCCTSISRGFRPTSGSK